MTERPDPPRDGDAPRPAFRSRWRRWRLLILAEGIVIGLAGFMAWNAYHHSASPSRFLVEEHEALRRSAATDPLAAGLKRCRALPANAVDPTCTAIWESNRRRFFGEP